MSASIPVFGDRPKAAPTPKLRALVKFPGNIVGTTGIEVSKANGNVTIETDWTDFSAISAIPTSPTSFILTFDSATGAYVLVPSHLLGGAASGIADAPNDGVQYGRQSANWTPVNSFLQAGTGAVTRTMQDKAREELDARDFGVAADGVTNDTVNLRKALAEHYASGKPLRLPTGIIIVSSVRGAAPDATPIPDVGTPALTLDLSKATTIYGSGRYSGNGETNVTILKDIGNGITIYGNGSAAPDRRVVLSDFTIQGNAGNTYGIDFRIVAALLYNLGVISCGADGIRWTSCFSGKIDQCWVSANQHRGIHLRETCNLVVVSNTICASNAAGGDLSVPNLEVSGAAIYGDALDISLLGSDFSGYGHAAFGVVVKDCTGLLLQGCDIETCATAAFYADNTAKGITLVDNTFVDGGLVLLEDSTNCAILPNTFINSSGTTTLQVLTATATDNIGIHGQVLVGGATEDFRGPGVYHVGRAPKADAALNQACSIVTVANGARVYLGAQAGNFSVWNPGTTECAIYFGDAGNVFSLVHSSGGAGEFVTPTTTPASGKSTIAFDGVDGLSLYNNTGASRNYRVFSVKFR